MARKNQSFPADTFCAILERIDQRCITADGPVTNTIAEATPNELHDLYVAAKQMKHEHEIVKLFWDRMARFGNWDDGCFYYNGTSASELQEPVLMMAAHAVPSKTR